ncbi:MAG: polysaccharide biosynthesis C-terminal domain-containing protein [Pirellulaceae bacterium]|nr:polysaccharide biosynthesis C-terminal domain-containing protein [Pirellulaceae bacterium]
MASICAALFLHVDVLMLRFMQGIEEVATYGVAIRLVGPLITVIGVMGVPLMPFFATHDSEQSTTGIRRRAWLASLCVFGSVWPISFAYMVSPDLLQLMTADTNIERAGVITALLGFVGVPLAFRAVGSLALITSGLGRSWLRVSAGALVANVTLNAVLIPRYGALGATIATLVTESVAAVGVFCCLPGAGRLPTTPRDYRGLVFAALLPPLLLFVIWCLAVPSGLLRLSLVASVAIALSVGFGIGPWSATIRRHVT